MKRSATLLAALLLLAGTAGAVAAADGPLADAGLDQEVALNTTVQLDATGSSHPDGTIDEYAWVLETPAGRTITPDCRDCARTAFQATEVGRYGVTLTVTDTEGRTDSDTLYVDVEEAGPTVDLDGPTAPPVDQPRRYNTTAGTTNAQLRNLTWRIGNLSVATTSLNGDTDTSQQPFTFEDEGPYRLEVIVVDTSDRTARDSLLIRPTTPDPENESTEPDPDPTPSDETSSPSGDSDTGPDENANENNREEETGCPTTGIGVNKQDSSDVAITCVLPGPNNDNTGERGTLKPNNFNTTCSESAGDCSWSDDTGSQDSSDPSGEPNSGYNNGYDSGGSGSSGGADTHPGSETGDQSDSVGFV